jgi:hypothetical protein
MLRATRRDPFTGKLRAVHFYRLCDTPTGPLLSHTCTDTGLEIVRSNTLLRTQEVRHPLEIPAITHSKKQEGALAA